jgi:hypothetical protein
MKSFNKHLTEQVISEAIEYHLENSIPFDECVFRYGSEKYFDFYNGLREAYNNDVIPNYAFNEEELEIIESDLGTFAEYAGETVPLDFIMEEETPELNKPKRGGPKKFFVHTRDPKTGNIKKVSFGDTTGLSVKYDNPERKKAFATRHNCSSKTDKTSPGYWSCRINRYMAKTPAGRSGFW